MAKLNYVDGFTIYNCRRIAQYAFADYYLKAEKNEDDMCFEIYLRDRLPDGTELDQDSVNYFKDCFCFKIIQFSNKEDYESY